MMTMTLWTACLFLSMASTSLSSLRVPSLALSSLSPLLLTMNLTDLPDVRDRARKGLATFFMIRKGIFANGKISRATKRVAHLALIAMVALRGCESWAVTAEIERTFRSFQTLHTRVMCGVSKRRTREDHISTASLLKTMGVEDVMHYCRCLQLNFLGTISRAPSSRIQRKIISSWMDEPRRKNYPQTCSRSTLKAMASVDIPEAHWQDLARDEVLCNKHVRQTDEDRDAQRQALFELHYDKDPAHHARILALSAFPVSQDQAAHVPLLSCCALRLPWVSRSSFPSIHTLARGPP